MVLKTLKIVSGDDWVVVYGNDGTKICEDHYINENIVNPIAKYFEHDIDYYEFTDYDEIDGETPDNFNDIEGIEKIN